MVRHLAGNAGPLFRLAGTAKGLRGLSEIVQQCRRDLTKHSVIPVALTINFFVGREEKMHHRGHGDHGERSPALLRELCGLCGETSLGLRLRRAIALVWRYANR